MNRRHFLTGALTLAVLPAAASAQTAEEQVIDQLKRQGYRRIEVYRTLLGRTRIVGSGARGRREIILNPSSGAILRDYEDRSYHDDDDDDEGYSSSGSGKSGGDDDSDDGGNSGKGNNNDDDDDHDDDDDEGDDDD